MKETPAARAAPGGEVMPLPGFTASSHPLCRAKPQWTAAVL